ncbi:MAG: formylmethanofuran dehydrogenase subunit C [Burkholderiales bacterium PBB5]|nr:MAG: formylmethanofuran dehydrogenase subunit C [Burkholderiales bacterium PBB5]
MNGLQLTLRHAPMLRLDLRGLLPLPLLALEAAALAARPVLLGNQALPLAELFDVQRFEADQPTLRLVGDLQRADHVGRGLGAGLLQVHGDVGDHAGTAMGGGELHIHGSAGDLAGCQLAGGRLQVHGDVGHHAASGLPGSLDGMRGGLFIVHGNAGHRLADRMRRGSLIVLGDVGDFAASRLVAGTLVLAGRVGTHVGWGQRRGSLVLLDPAFQPGPTWVPAGAEAPVAWQLLARSIARLAADLGPAAQALHTLPRRAIRRHLGDLAVDGRGELIQVL